MARKKPIGPRPAPLPPGTDVWYVSPIGGQRYNNRLPTKSEAAAIETAHRLRRACTIVSTQGTLALDPNHTHRNQSLDFELAIEHGYLLASDPDGHGVSLSRHCTLCGGLHIDHKCEVSLSAAGLAFLEAEQTRLKEMNQNLLEDCRGLAHPEMRADFKESDRSGVVDGERHNHDDI